MPLLHPERYQGRKFNSDYFEGWYFKWVDATRQNGLVVIPGIAKGRDPHAFIQLLSPTLQKSTYYRFPMTDFFASRKKFHIKIHQNEFSQKKVVLNLASGELRVQGEICTNNLNSWPVRLWSPGAMGWYAWLPAMQCYHGILSMDHALQGHMRINDRMIDFTEGRGYTEKDWGTGFPSAYIWMQSNHFDKPGTSLSLSVATIPWLKGHFTGFIVGLLNEQKLYRWTTYNRSAIERIEVNDHQILLKFANRNTRLQVNIERTGQPEKLLGPERGNMTSRIMESLDTKADIQLQSLKDDRFYIGRGEWAGLEVQGDISKLQPGRRLI
jgi:tocopherol cyclase